MNIFAFFLGSVLLLNAVVAAPAEVSAEDDLQGLVRDKRNPKDVIPKVGETEALPSLPAVELPAVSDAVDPLIADPPGIEVSRAKKQACLQTPCGTLPSCAGLPCAEPSARSAEPERPVLMEVRPRPMARTIDPVINFGPVSLGGSGGYGSSLYSAPLRTSFASSGLQSYGASALQSYAPSGVQSYAPSGLQFSAVIPMHHHHPLLHHNIDLSHNVAYEPRPEVVYYNAPEPIYVAAPVNTIAEAPAHEAPLSLYCESLKKKEGKALEERANLTEDSALADQIARVNEVREEIQTLNNAAQRIVDQQERLVRLHQDHMSMIAAKNADPYPPHLRSLEPLMRHHESHYRMPYGMYGGGYMRPGFYRSAEEPAATTAAPPAAPVAESAKPTAQPAAPAPAPQAAPMSLPSMRSDGFMRPGYGYGGYPSYGSYGYGYRAEPAYMGQASYYPQEARSETGFQVPALFSRSDQAATQEEARQLFSKMMDMGQRMGVIPKDFKMTAVENKQMAEEKAQSEDALSDLMFGANQKPLSQSPAKVDMPLNENHAQSKKDKRGLIQKIKA